MLDFVATFLWRLATTGVTTAALGTCTGLLHDFGDDLFIRLPFLLPTTTAPIELIIARPPNHLKALPTKKDGNHDGSRGVDPPPTTPDTIYDGTDQQRTAKLYAR